MPEQEGYLGIIELLKEALLHLEEGEAKTLVQKALLETSRQAQQAATSLEMGMELGRLLSREEESDE